MTNLFGHIAYIFIVIGMILLSYKRWEGWLFRFVGEFVWMFIGLYLGMSSIWFWGLVFILIDLYGAILWKSGR